MSLWCFNDYFLDTFLKMAFVDVRTMFMFLSPTRIHTLHGVTISFSRAPCRTLNFVLRAIGSLHVRRSGPTVDTNEKDDTSIHVNE